MSDNINSLNTRRNLRPAKNLFFDIDETLIQTEYLRMKIRNNYLSKILGLPKIEFSEYCKDCVGKSLKNHILPWLFGKYGDCFDKEKAYQELCQREAEMYQKGALKPMPYVREFLEKMSKRGIKMAACSGADKNILRKKLESANLSDFFPDDLLFSRNEANGHFKPSPEIYFVAKKALGANYSDSRIFEDNQEGILAGDRAFMPVIAMPTRWSESQDFDKALMIAPNGFSDILKFSKYYLGFSLENNDLNKKTA